MWESTSMLPNYTRPGATGPIQDMSQRIQLDDDNLEDVILDILQNHYAGLSLDAGDMDDCIAYIKKSLGSGGKITTNSLKRAIGYWLITEHHIPQTEYDEGYRELSYS